MRRRMVYVERTDEGWNLEDSAAYSGGARRHENENAPIALVSGGKLVGIGAVPSAAPAGSDDDDAAASTSSVPTGDAAAAAPRRSRQRTLMERTGSLILMSNPDPVLGSAPAVVASIRRTQLLYYVVVSLTVAVLVVQTGVILASQDVARATPPTPVFALPPHTTSSQIIFNKEEDAHAALGTPRFSIRTPAAASSLLSLGTTALQSVVNTSALVAHAIVLVVMHALGSWCVWRLSKIGLSLYAAVVLAWTVSRISGPGVFVGINHGGTDGVYDAGGAPTFWFAMRSLSDVTCVIIALSLRAKLSPAWISSYRPGYWS